MAKNHATAIIEVSHGTYKELRDKMADYGLSAQIIDGGDDKGEVLDMYGLGLREEPATKTEHLQDDPRASDPRNRKRRL